MLPCNWSEESCALTGAGIFKRPIQGIPQVLLTITIYTHEEIFLLMEGIIFY